MSIHILNQVICRSLNQQFLLAQSLRSATPYNFRPCLILLFWDLCLKRTRHVEVRPWSVYIDHVVLEVTESRFRLEQNSLLPWTLIYCKNKRTWFLLSFLLSKVQSDWLYLMCPHVSWSFHNEASCAKIMNTQIPTNFKDFWDQGDDLTPLQLHICDCLA